MINLGVEQERMSKFFQEREILAITVKEMGQVCFNNDVILMPGHKLIRKCTYPRIISCIRSSMSLINGRPTLWVGNSTLIT